MSCLGHTAPVPAQEPSGSRSASLALVLLTLMLDAGLPDLHSSALSLSAARQGGPSQQGQRQQRPRGAGSCVLRPSVLYSLINDLQGDKGQGWLSVRGGGRMRILAEDKQAHTLLVSPFLLPV